MRLDAGPFALIGTGATGYGLFYAVQHFRGLLEFPSMFDARILQRSIPMRCQAAISQYTIIDSSFAADKRFVKVAIRRVDNAFLSKQRVGDKTAR
jgi:hypothetical protein